MQNWFGMMPHATDKLVHWSERIKDAQEKAKKVRICHDKIKKAGFEKQLDVLISAGYDLGCDETHEQYSEDM